MKKDHGARCARLILLGCAGIAASPGRSAAADMQAIVVTGNRLEPDDTPATSESIDAARIRATTNVVNVEDSLRYLPSLLVRKRHIGDTQAPLATRTAGVGASARSLIYADGILLSALIGNNNTFASPRWGLVAPEEVARIDVHYGPFSAAYPGNSIGAVVEIETRLPDGPTGSLVAQGSIQDFSQYRSEENPLSRRVAGTWGGRRGPLACFVGANHLTSHGQPLSYVTAARPAAAGTAGLPVSGAVDAVSRTGAPVFLLGAGGIETQQQDTISLRLAYDLTPSVRIGYRGALFLNDTDARAESYLRDALGATVYAGALNIGGRAVTVPASAFSSTVYRLDQRHWMHALSLDGESGDLAWRAIASRYDFDRDVQRSPFSVLPAAADGGPGSIARLDGTGWETLDLSGRWRDGLRFGLHADRFTLANERSATADWRSGAPGALIQASRGRTRTLALWAEQRNDLAPALELIFGARYEDWRAWDGFNFSATPALSVAQPEQHRQGLSPKASLRWRPAEGWGVTLSAAQAWRFPTVSELYQAVATGPVLSVPDPNLRPERARSAELAIERRWDRGHVRLSLFHERIRDALISQTAPLQAGSTILASFVQNVDEVRTNGAELAFDWRDLVPGFALSGSVTLADPEVIADPAFPAAEGKDLPQVPRRRATLVATWRPSERAAFTLAGRYASRAYATIDNSDLVARTWQGFQSYLVIDARATLRLSRQIEAALGVENLGNARYFLFHPFPQRSVSAEIAYRW